MVAAPASEIKFGVVDLNRALNSVEEGKTARTNLEAEAGKRKGEMDKRQKDLEKMQTELQDLERKMQTLQLSDAEKKRGMELNQKFQKSLKEGAELSEKYTQEMNEKKFKMEQDIIRKLRVVVEDMSRTAAYTLVFDKTESGLIYAAQADDLTERVIQKYNSEHKGSGAKKK